MRAPTFCVIYIDEIILEILGDARYQSTPTAAAQQAYASNELRARILAIPGRVGVDDVPKMSDLRAKKSD